MLIYRVAFLLVLVGVMFSCGCKKQDPPVQDERSKLKITSIRVEEGDTNSVRSVKAELDKSSADDIQINYRFIDESAVHGEDYSSTINTIIIPAGQTEAQIYFTIIGDTLLEPDETFRIAIDQANANVIEKAATVTILNDDTAVNIPTDGYATPTSYAGYRLVWQDEFNGNSVSNDWTFEIGDHGWGNNEWQYYTNGQNVSVFDGNLVIEAREEAFQGANYTSTRMITQNKQSFQYGRIDIRAVLPEGQGIWPALWMLGDNFSSVGWPACGEIDIMEIVGHEPSTVHGTIHWDNSGHVEYGDSYTLANGKKFSDEFHVFSIIWDETTIKWLMNDIQYNEVAITPAHMSEFHATFFFIFNIAVGGNWPGYPNATTQFPQRMIVDYVRVFQEI